VSVVCRTDVVFQYFIGVTLLAVIPEVPEIVIGLQFALQNNISLRQGFSSVRLPHTGLLNKHY